MRKKIVVPIRTWFRSIKAEPKDRITRRIRKILDMFCGRMRRSQRSCRMHRHCVTSLPCRHRFHSPGSSCQRGEKHPRPFGLLPGRFHWSEFDSMKERDQRPWNSLLATKRIAATPRSILDKSHRRFGYNSGIF